MIDDKNICWPHAAAPAPEAARRVLMLPYFFPPNERIGARRPAGLARWLEEFGWQPVIVTVERAGTAADIIQVPVTSWLKRMREASRSQRALSYAVSAGHGAVWKVKQSLRHHLRSMLHWYDAHAGWGAKVAERAIAEGRRQQVDLVWTTCDPFAMAAVARRVARELAVPYIIDFRDPLPGYLPTEKSSRHWLLQAAHEAAAVTVAAPVCVSPTLSHVLTGSARVIISGTWREEHVPSQRSEHFRLLHAAMPSFSERNPSNLFKALSLLTDRYPDFRANTRLALIGPGSQQMVELVGFPAIADMCDVIPEMPYAEVVELMRESSILVIVKGDADAVSSDAIPGKFFDYLPFEAPILALGGEEGILGSLLAWSDAGRWCATAEDVADFLGGCYQAWKSGEIVTLPRNREALDYLSQRRMTGEFAEVFNAIVEKRPCNCRRCPLWEA